MSSRITRIIRRNGEAVRKKLMSRSVEEETTPEAVPPTITVLQTLRYAPSTDTVSVLHIHQGVQIAGCRAATGEG